MSHGRPRARTAAVLALAALSLTTAACGRESTSSSDTSSSKSASSDAPIKLFSIAASGSPIQNYPDIEAGAKAAVKAINEAGGVNGRKLEYTFCNDQADANKSVACARQAVQEKVAAVVGQVSLFDAQTLPLLESAGIPSIGLTTPGNEVDVTSKASFPFSAGTFSDYVALPDGLKLAGSKKVAVAAADLPSAIAGGELVGKGTKDVGLQWGGIVKIPPTGVTDFAPYAQKLKATDADSIVLVTTPAQTQAIVKASQALGMKIRWGHHTISFGESEAATLGDPVEGMILSGPNPSYRDTSTPGIKEFDDQMKAAGFIKPILYRTAGINAWLSVYAVAELAKKVDGDITAASLSAAAASASGIDLKGIATWNPSTPGPSKYPRVSASKIYFQKIENGKTVDAGFEPVDAMPLLEGGGD
jgi:ABC-type branched-subunit amino acid transport system substrate-binding protein